jgi:hypothetical protein
MKGFKRTSSATTWLNAAAVLFLVFGVIAGPAIGSQQFGGDVYSAQATWFGWAIFAFGFACFVLFASIAAVVARLTSIGYLLSLQVEDKLAREDRQAASPAIAASVR